MKTCEITIKTRGNFGVRSVARLQLVGPALLGVVSVQRQLVRLAPPGGHPATQSCLRLWRELGLFGTTSEINQAGRPLPASG
jgi:hypothetical protein